VKSGDDWTPEIAEGARILYARAQREQDKSSVERIWRLGTKLAAVWRSIPSDKRELLFLVACETPGFVRTMTCKDVDSEIERCRRTAEEIRHLIDYVPRDRGQAALKIAEDFEKAATRLAAYNGPWMVQKHTAYPPQIRGYVLNLSKEFSMVLNRPHDKLVAEIATGAFGLKKRISQRDVHYWRTYAGNQNSGN
jgi:hypothetical protein